MLRCTQTESVADRVDMDIHRSKSTVDWNCTADDADSSENIERVALWLATANALRMIHQYPVNTPGWLARLDVALCFDTSRYTSPKRQF